VASSTASTSATTATRPPVTVRVQWTDGTEGEVNGWTSQWTGTHVCVYRESAPPYHPVGCEPSTFDAGSGPPSAVSEQARRCVRRIRDRFSEDDGRLDDDRQGADRQVIFAYAGVPIRFRTTIRSKANAFSHSSGIVASAYSRVRSTLNGVWVPTLMTISSPSLITS
jgi:hypothetical protein